MRYKHVRVLLVLAVLFSFLPFFEQSGICSSMGAVQMATGKADAEQKEETSRFLSSLTVSALMLSLQGWTPSR